MAKRYRIRFDANGVPPAAYRLDGMPSAEAALRKAIKKAGMAGIDGRITIDVTELPEVECETAD